MAALPACLQPRLGLQVYGFVPAGCIGYLIDDDDNDPVLREGDIAVVDVNDREPENGALFLIEWSNGLRDVRETFLRPNRQADGTEAVRWWTGAYGRPHDRHEAMRRIRAGTLTCIDGPYARTEYLAEKLVGKVVGVLAPDRHTRDERSRRIYASRRGAAPIEDGSCLEPGYVEPAGSAMYRRPRVELLEPPAKPRRRRRAA